MANLQEEKIKGRSELTVAKLIQNVAEVEVIDLEHALKNKEKERGRKMKGRLVKAG